MVLSNYPLCIGRRRSNHSLAVIGLEALQQYYYSIPHIYVRYDNLISNNFLMIYTNNPHQGLDVTPG